MKLHPHLVVAPGSIMDVVGFLLRDIAAHVSLVQMHVLSINAKGAVSSKRPIDRIQQFVFTP